MTEPYELKKQPFFISENPKFPYVYILLYGAIIIVHTASFSRMINEWLFGEHLEESGCMVTDAPSQYFQEI
jgi:hypothetical protein